MRQTTIFNPPGKCYTDTEDKTWDIENISINAWVDYLFPVPRVTEVQCYNQRDHNLFFAPSCPNSWQLTLTFS